MAYSREVKEFAKELFLTVGSDGNHKYSQNEIVEEISKKFLDLETIPSQRLISNWSSKKDKTTGKSWRDIWKAGVRSGIQQANVDTENELSADEKFEVQIDKITNLRVKNAIEIAKNFSEKIEKSPKKIGNIDIKMLKVSETIFNNLNLEEKEDSDSDNTTIFIDEFNQIMDKGLEEIDED